MSKQILVPSKPLISDVLPPSFRPASVLTNSDNNRRMTDTKLKDISVKKNESISDEKVQTHLDKPTIFSESNYFTIFDDGASLDFFDNSDEIIDEKDNTFVNDLLISPILQKTFSLEQSSVQSNFLLKTIRFVDDVIFIFNKPKTLELVSIGLIAGIVASSLYLPGDIGIGISFLLSAPLFICLTGILAKFLKKKNR